VLEIGCGQGSVGSLLARDRDYVGLEPDRQSFETAERRIGARGQVLQVDVESFESERTFELVCAFEVLEHLEDDRSALSRWAGRARPGGWVMLSVPAGAGRFGPTDVKAGHYRRYDRADLDALLAAAGLEEIVVHAYGFPLGYGLEAARNLLLRGRADSGSLAERTAASGRWMQPPEWSGPIMRLVTAPFGLAQRPFAGTRLGTGLVARGRRPES
jgi:SAM-dependent methyltransferase